MVKELIFNIHQDSRQLFVTVSDALYTVKNSGRNQVKVAQS